MIAGQLWKWTSGGLLFLLILTGIALGMEKRSHGKAKAQIVKLSATLERISSERNEQKAETAERIKVITRVITEADKRARVIEKAPLPGQCRTPDAVLNAEI